MTDDKWQVHFARSAVTDLDEILNFVFERDGAERAKKLLMQFRDCKANLTTLPERGHYPPEMKRLNIWEFREIHVGVYRLIYHVNEAQKAVVIHAIFDSRRHVDELLQARLLRVPAREKGKKGFHE